MLGNEIRLRRKRLGLTQRALADLLNVKPATMCQYENGTNEMSFVMLKSIAKILKCSAVDLAYEELGEEPPSEVKTKGERAAEIASVDLSKVFYDSLDVEIIGLIKDLDVIAKEKVIAYIRDQKVITAYYKSVKEKLSKH